MNELVKALNAIAEQEWFRQKMGMKRQAVCHSLILVFLLFCLSAHPEQKHD